MTMSSLKLTILSSLVVATVVSGNCGSEDDDGSDKNEALKFKVAAIASVLGAGAIGVSLPILGRRFQVLRPENDVFFMIKAFAAGVILATGLVHILPDAFRSLTSPCLGENPWGKFPFAGFVAMMAAIGTLMVDTVATSFYKNMHFDKSKLVSVDEEAAADDHAGHVHVHTHATHGHAHGAAGVPSVTTDLVRQRIISQVCINSSYFSPSISCVCGLCYVQNE